jgi:hypothetical protein
MSKGTEIIDAVSIHADRQAERSNGLQRAFSILLFSVFVVVDLLALAAGTSSYGSITSMQATNDARIMSLGPIMSSVRANDTIGGVEYANGPEGQVLVLVQSDVKGTYETRIYLYEGKILQEYALEGTPYTPNKATVLAESSTFDFSYENGLLTVTTDAGTAKIALRHLQGGV